MRTDGDICRAKGCGVEADGFMCGRHFGMVPPAIRAALEAGADPRTYSSSLAAAAIDAVAHKESRAQGPRRRRAPVQLSLFET